MTKKRIKPRYWTDVERNLRDEYGDKLNTSHLHLGMRKPYMQDCRVRVVEIRHGKIVSNQVGKIYLSEGHTPRFLLIRRPGAEFTKQLSLTPEHVVTEMYDDEIKKWLKVIECGEGHYGLPESHCKKALGHLRDCSKKKNDEELGGTENVGD